MTAVLRYAARSLGRRPATAALLAVSLGLAAGLPGAVRRVVAAFEAELTGRAEAAPLVLGAKGSRADLVLHALYFRTGPPGSITVADRKAFDRQGLADSAAVAVTATVRGEPVVGTEPAYFRLRGLRLGAGSPVGRLGDCVVGAEAARRLGVAPGDRVATDAENLFSPSGGVPVRLRVTGVLAPAASADDGAVFTGLETVWLIQGRGHAHENRSATHEHDAGGEAGAAGGFVEVTDSNAESFHFHGRPDRFPLTAVIARPRDEAARVLLAGRYARDPAAQVAEADRVVRELLDVALRLRGLFDANAALTGAAVALLCGSVVALTLRLRRPELRAMGRLGLSRGRVAALLAAEFGLVAVAAAAAGAGIVWLAAAAAPVLFRWLVV